MRDSYVSSKTVTVKEYEAYYTAGQIFICLFYFMCYFIVLM